ncbi:MAG: hypothetical protein QOF10_505 [Kribbellaceae bacterium]|nr:hypothetical protein [Kribbellaceae bacterium]
MSDQTNPPNSQHRPGAAGGPQGPSTGPPQNHPNPYAGPQGPGNPAQPQPGQYLPPQQHSSQGPGQLDQPGPGNQQGPAYGPGAGDQPGPGALWPQAGQPGSPDYPQQGSQYGPGAGASPYGQGAGQPQYGGGQGQPQYGPGAGQPQYGGGQPPYGAGYPLAQEWEPEPKKRRGKLIPLVAVLAVLAVVSGGAVFAYARLNGGDQPAAVLPGNAVAYARIDLNPSAGQKVAALRFLMKFPSAKEQIGLTSDKDDLRLKLFELIKEDAGDNLADVDFDKDIKPWLGDRAGIAALPGQEDKPEVVVAVQVKNEDEATKGLDKLFAAEQDKPKRAFAKGYVLLSDQQAPVDAAVAASKKDSLQDNAKFDKDMSALGEQGFASFWADTKGLALASGNRLTDEQRAALPEGSAAAALRFDSQYVELKGVVHGDRSLKVSNSEAGDVVAKLPDTTAGALALSDGANLVSTIWTQLEKSTGNAGINLGELTKNFTDEYGLVLPDDLKPLLGNNLAISIDKETANGPKIAARMETDPAKAEEVVKKVTDLIRTRTPVNVPIEQAKDEDTLVISTQQGYAEEVLKGGNLGQSENFKQAIPDSKGAVMVGYVDFEAAASLSDRLTSDKDYAALRSAGYTVRVANDGEADFTLRVVAK